MLVRTALIAAAIATGAAHAGTAAPVLKPELWTGTWQLDAARSKFNPPELSVRSETRTYTVSGNHVTMRSIQVVNSGRTIDWSFSAPTNGQWAQIIGTGNANRISLMLVNDHELKAESRLNDTPAAHWTAIVSRDGNELTVHRSLLTPKGGPTDDTMVFKRSKSTTAPTLDQRI